MTILWKKWRYRWKGVWKERNFGSTGTNEWYLDVSDRQPPRWNDRCRYYGLQRVSNKVSIMSMAHSARSKKNKFVSSHDPCISFIRVSCFWPIPLQAETNYLLDLEFLSLISDRLGALGQLYHVKNLTLFHWHDVHKKLCWVVPPYYVLNATHTSWPCWASLCRSVGW